MSIPQTFMCPITMEVMKEPWMDTDGNSYEKEAIFNWVQLHQNSPITRNPLNTSQLVPNRALKDLIEQYMSQNTLSPPIINSVVTGETSHLSINGPVSLIMIADTSGSMGESCDNQNQSERLGFNRLDLVKHTMNTLIESLSSDDSVALVKFNSRATALTNIVNATDSNKSQLKNMISNLIPDGGTNIWDALRTALELSKKANTKIDILLFTDGESNENPPRGIIQTLKDYPNINSMNISIHTYGFGNNINSKLLYDISCQKNGMFGFIPDSTMIGTVFVNSLSYLMTNKHIINFDNTDSHIQNEFIQFLSNTILTEQNNVSDFIQYMNSNNSAFANALKSDLIETNDDDGQITKALNPRYYRTWGKHYLYSVLSAYQNKLCLNFKDNGVQHFKTPQFEQVQRFIENVFVNLPPPIPSNKPYTGPVSSVNFSNSFYNVSGGCFTDSTVLHTSNGFVQAKDIRKGMNVLTDSRFATVVCVIKFKFSGTVCKYGTTGITPFHPIYIENKEWEFPHNMDVFEKEHYDGYVYDFVLDKNHIVRLNHFFAVTLGHNFKEDVVSHDYFGDKIMTDLINHKDWESGLIQLDNWKFIRNKENMVIGMNYV